MEREQLTQLVLAAQQGDNNAISALFNAFQNTVYNIALRETKDPETAADVVQESFIEVIQTIGKLQEPAAFVTWLKTITYHQCTRYYRKKENKHESLVEEREDAPALFDTLEEENVEFIPDKAMESEEFRRTIRTFIDKLPDVQRSAIMMKYFDDLSVKEIAAVQGVSENTVLSRLYYGRNAIKAEVEAYEKKHDTKLHAIPFLPLFRLLFNESPAQMPPVAAAAAAQAVGTATGVSLSTAATTAGVAGATTAAGVGAGGAAATVATGVGVAVKAAAIPLAAKIAAGIVAAVVAVTAPVVITRAVKDKDRDTSGSDYSSETEPVVMIPADAVEYEGRYYKFYNESLSWNEAKDACEDLGGHLATITSTQEQAFLSDYVYEAGKYCYWLGGHKTDDGWRWVTGEPMNYANWSMGEPNAQTYGENYLHLFATEWIGAIGMKWVGEWNDASNHGAPYAGQFYELSNFGYICEWDSGNLQQLTTTAPTEPTIPAATDSATTTHTTTATVRPAWVPADVVEYNGHFYKRYEETLSWDEAKAACEELGGHLATITTAEEQAAVMAYLEQGSQHDCWIGSRRDNKQWIWITDEPFEYSNWASWEPNGFGGMEDRVCIILGANAGCWADTPNEGFGYREYDFLCEWDGYTTSSSTTGTTMPTTSASATTGVSQSGVTTTTTNPPTTTTTTAPIVYDEPTIVVSDAEVSAGDTVQITVRLKNNPGLVSAVVKVGYDADVLTLVGYANGDFTAAGYGYSEVNHNPFMINWCHSTAPDSTTELLATLTFRVAEDAVAGDYPLTLTYDCAGDFFTSTWDTVYFAADEGVVRVKTTTATGGGGFNEAYLAFCDCATYEAVCTECLLCDQCCACPNPNLRCADCGGGICPAGGECVVCNDCLHGNAFQDNERIEW